MAYVAVDLGGDENMYGHHPYRAKVEWADIDCYISLPKGSIEKLIGRKLTWADEPVKLEEK